MGESIIFVEQDRIGHITNGGMRYYQSDYLVRYQQNLKQIRDRNAWKNEGAGAAFRGEARQPQPDRDEEARATVNSVDALEDGRAVYSVSSGDFSGIYIKPLADGEPEGHVLHHAKLDFGAVAVSPDGSELAVSVRTEGPERHIALVGLSGGNARTLTEGDSVDDSPSWGRAGRRIYYSSAGIGRDMSGGFRGLGPAAVCCLDLDRREVEDVCSQPGQDCLLPREGADGSLYFLRRPHADPNQRMSLVDMLMVPYKILKGLFRFIEMFTHSYTGQTFNTRGTNPARSRQQDSRELFIQGNLINVEKTLKENQSRGEAYPGIAPAGWQLVRRVSDGKIAVVKRGVLDYDVAPNGDLVYSNGKYIMRLKADGSEEKLAKAELAVRVRVR